MADRRFSVLALVMGIACQAVFASQVVGQIEYQPTELTAPTAPLLPGQLGIDGAIADPGQMHDAATSNPMLWQQYQALQAGGPPSSESCETCGGGGFSDYDRCGCNLKLFPWITGPGNCDRWCVGPKWEIDGGAIFMFRDNANWAGVIAANGGPAPQLIDQFEHGLGGRVFVTGYNDEGLGIQVGYEGINGWNARLDYALGDFVANETRSLNYESQLNSLEINFLRRTPSPWQVFSGFRYVQLDEDFIDLSINDKPIPLPADPPAAPAAFADTGLSHLLKNQLFGLQLGTRRDAWQLGTRFTVHTFANAGVYCNRFRREDVDLTITTVITGDDLATPNVNEFSETVTTSQTGLRRDFADIAFLGEAGISGTLRLNHCTAVRAGYQVLALDGVSQGLDAFLFPNVGLDSSTLVFHGLQFGLEYRR